MKILKFIWFSWAISTAFSFTYQLGFEKGRLGSDNDWPRITFNGPIQFAPGVRTTMDCHGARIEVIDKRFYSNQVN